jgi:hypothetical protein
MKKKKVQIRMKVLYKTAKRPIYHIPNTIYHIPYTIYHIPYTIYHIPYTLYLIPYTIYHIPYIKCSALVVITIHPLYDSTLLCCPPSKQIPFTHYTTPHSCRTTSPPATAFATNNAHHTTPDTTPDKTSHLTQHVSRNT